MIIKKQKKSNVSNLKKRSNLMFLYNLHPHGGYDNDNITVHRNKWNIITIGKWKNPTCQHLEITGGNDFIGAESIILGWRQIFRIKEWYSGIAISEDIITVFFNDFPLKIPLIY